MNTADPGFDGQDAAIGVRVLGVVESKAPATMRYQPDNPLANKDGYVFMSNVQRHRRDDQHDFGQSLFRNQRGSDQHRTRPAAQNHLDGPLKPADGPLKPLGNIYDHSHDISQSELHRAERRRLVDERLGHRSPREQYDAGRHEFPDG